MTRPYDPDETRELLAATLRRNHPELTDAEINRLLTGEPARRRQSRDIRHGWVDNRGKRTSRYEAVSGGRTTSACGVTSDQAEQGE